MLLAALETNLFYRRSLTMPKNYFLDTKVTGSTVDNAVDKEEKEDLTATTREILKNIYEKLVVMVGGGDADQKAMATSSLSR